MWAAALAGLAGATELDARAALYDAMLAEAAWGDLDAAVATYKRLSRSLPDRDPVATEALFWLGHALDQRGSAEEAREALIGGIATGRCDGCRALLERIAIDEESVTVVPVRWTFDDARHGFFHPWTLQDAGAIRLAPGPDGDPALEWTSMAEARRPDQLVVGFRSPSPPPVGLRFEITAADRPALLQLWAQDADGRVYTLPEPVVLAPGAPRPVAVTLAALAPAEPGPPLDPARLSRVVLVDVTGGRQPGPHRVWLDDFEVR